VLPRLLLAPTLAVLLAGCSGSTSLQLTFATTPQLCTTQQLLAEIDALELILDAPAGFSGATTQGPAGSLEARDVDGDGVLELVLRRAVHGALPQLQLLPGSNGQHSFEIRVHGLAGATIAATGGLASVSFSAGVATDLTVPIDLRPDRRPPSVISTTPAAGASLAQPFTVVSVEFSSVIDTTSLTGLRLVLGDNPTSGNGWVQWTTQSRTVQQWGVEERRSVATARLPAGCAPGAGDYRIEASSPIKDLHGRPLDQDAADPATNSFSATFTVAGVSTGSICGGCAEGTECYPVQPVQPGQRYVCKGGQCVPASGSCPQPCPDKYVCRPSTDPSGSGECVLDCRIEPSTCAATVVCDASSGLCTVDCKQACAAECAKDQTLCDQCLASCKK
jgi:hypothetical protein